MAGFNDVIPLQSSDTNKKGTELTIYDLHDYTGGSDEGIVYADVAERTFTFYDADGNEIGIVDATVVFNDDYSVTIAVDKDRYIESHLKIILTDTTEYTNIEKIGVVSQARFKRNQVIEGNRTNGRVYLQDIIDQSGQFMDDAIFGHKYGDAPYLFDERMDDANLLLNSVKSC